MERRLLLETERLQLLQSLTQLQLQRLRQLEYRLSPPQVLRIPEPPTPAMQEQLERLSQVAAQRPMQLPQEHRLTVGTGQPLDLTSRQLPPEPPPPARQQLAQELGLLPSSRPSSQG